MRVLVCGGRNFGDKHFIFECLSSYHKNTPITKLIHGAAKGVDSLAGLWAAKNNIPVITFPILPKDWSLYGNEAGLVRNKMMLVSSHPEMVIAFPGGNGTKHMVTISKKAGIPVTFYHKDIQK